MWIFDGEEWVEEGAETSKETPRPIHDMDAFVPELQVIEIVPIPRNIPVPPFPLP